MKGRFQIVPTIIISEYHGRKIVLSIKNVTANREHYNARNDQGENNCTPSTQCVKHTSKNEMQNSSKAAIIVSSWILKEWPKAKGD